MKDATEVSADDVRAKLLKVSSAALDAALEKMSIRSMKYEDIDQLVRTAVVALDAATVPRTIDPPPDGGRLALKPRPIDPPPDGG